MKEADLWNADLYDSKHAFVYQYGEDLVKLLNPQRGERVLDLGCGTGYLTNLIAESGADVIGIDNSETMIRKAKSAYPDIDFKVMSAEDFYFENKFDAIFSNAVLHWVRGYKNAISCMYSNLKTAGKIVIEFGGKNNVKRIIDALKITLKEFGYTENAQREFWFFPSLAEYAALLEAQEFTVRLASYYDRKTELSDNASGIKDWIKMFGEHFLEGIKEEDIDEILSVSQEKMRPTNYEDGKWFADYKRLRIVAHKEPGTEIKST